MSFYFFILYLFFCFFFLLFLHMPMKAQLHYLSSDVFQVQCQKISPLVKRNEWNKVLSFKEEQIKRITKRRSYKYQKKLFLLCQDIILVSISCYQTIISIDSLNLTSIGYQNLLSLISISNYTLST